MIDRPGRFREQHANLGRRAGSERGEVGRWAGTDRGAATVLTLALAGVLILVTVGCAWVAGLVVGHRQTQSAADLAALAGAAAVQDGKDPCGAARDLATANDASLTACRVEGDDVWVQVSRPGRRLAGIGIDLTARAHAGPVTSAADVVTSGRPSDRLA